MKSLKDLLLLGNPLLYQVSEPVKESEKDQISAWVSDLKNVMDEVRSKYNFGRAIAAPQLGIMKRLIYMDVKNPQIIINPVILSKSEEMFTLWDDCMCFPLLLVQLERHTEISVRFKDENWNDVHRDLKGSLSELFQHEHDHLDGILCIMRAKNNTSFKYRSLS